MIATKRSVRILALVLIVAMMFALAADVMAASSKTVSVSRQNRYGYATVTTGSGFFYSLGWKKTTVTIKNTGRYSVSVYNDTIGPIYKGDIYPGQTKTFTFSGSGQRQRLMFQYVYGNTTLSVSTNAGSVS